MYLFKVQYKLITVFKGKKHEKFYVKLEKKVPLYFYYTLKGLIFILYLTLLFNINYLLY